MNKLTTGIEVFCFISAWLLIATFAWRGGITNNTTSQLGTGADANGGRNAPLVVVVPNR